MSDSTLDCCSEPEQKLLSVDEGRKRILQAVEAITSSEQLPLLSALGRITASTIIANTDVPPFDNSAMDGYAVRSDDCSGPAIRLQVIGSSFAGRPFSGDVSPDQCVRIMTGAVMPDGADAVVMQEHVAQQADQIHFSGAVAAGQNVRYTAEDTRRGEVVLEPGTRLGAPEIALLASVGVGELQVKRRLRVVFFSTGDELSSVGNALEPGKIYDSNRYAM
ncbi:MAG: molybdopterin molybdotransferase MoeA, partial [Thiogranum sp.]|nr:molybdopterin molybdotransferase MoeA [Thiogranum sp.]